MEYKIPCIYNALHIYKTNKNVYNYDDYSKEYMILLLSLI